MDERRRAEIPAAAMKSGMSLREEEEEEGECGRVREETLAGKETKEVGEGGGGGEG